MNLVFGTSDSRRFYVRRGKRLFDAVASALAIAALLPAFLIIALLVKFTSRGPIFYSQQRAGREGHLFRIVKFRSMRHDSHQAGSPITCGGDGRVTTFGRILRGSKIDELPQLWNVLKGDMSLVGPRPEVPAYVRRYSLRQRKVLTIRPGITDLASLKYRREEELLGRACDPGRYYEEAILPDKLDLGLSYVAEYSFFYDLRLLWKTIGVIVGVEKKRPEIRSAISYSGAGEAAGKVTEIASVATNTTPTFVSASTASPSL